MKIIFTAEIISKGRITIPQAIRDALGLREGDLAEVEINRKITPEPKTIKAEVPST